MQPRGRPAHSALPTNPQFYGNPNYFPQHGYANPQTLPPNIGAMAAHALTVSLANPYGNASHNHVSYTNANYHAYFTQTQHAATTAQGYTLSSTYVPQAAGPSGQADLQLCPRANHGRNPDHRAVDHAPRSYTRSTFSVPGDTRCRHEGCMFTGSRKAVEIHMMDRHLIFPPGWKKSKDDWDTDPSLKGKPVPIPGTGVTLNTPEAIDAWLAERRKKWPSKHLVEEKKRKAQEAAERGEIDPNELTARCRKRQRVGDDSWEHENRGGGRGRGRGRGKGRGRCRGHDKGEWKGGRTDSGWRGRGRSGGVASTPSRMDSQNARGEGRAEIRDKCPVESPLSEEPDSGSDMDPIKDAVSSKTTRVSPGVFKENPSEEGQRNPEDPEDGLSVINEHAASNNVDPSTSVRRLVRPRKLAQPRALPSNPFAMRPSLLRNLLLPEIRHTISNLSQAIHFLVENDFLENVELKPGDADSQRIKVLERSESADPIRNTVQG